MITNPKEKALFNEYVEKDFPIEFPRVEMSIIVNLLQYHDPNGWKTSAEIKKYDKNSPLRFTSDWSNLDNIMKRLIKKSIVETSTITGPGSRKGRTKTYRVWRLKRSKTSRERVARNVTNFSLRRFIAAQENISLLKTLRQSNYEHDEPIRNIKEIIEEANVLNRFAENLRNEISQLVKNQREFTDNMDQILKEHNKKPID